MTYTAGGCGSPVTQLKYYSGSAASGTLLKTVDKTYRDLPNPYNNDMNIDAPDPQLLTSTKTTWPNGQQSQELLTYDSGFTFVDKNPNNSGTTQYTSSYGLDTSDSHSDYANGAPGSLLSTTSTTYWALSHPSYVTANILNLPSSIITSDVSGNKCAETDYGYDESTADSSGVTEQHVSAPNSVRGNLTSVTRQLFNSPCSSPNPSSTPLTTTNHLYDTGMIHTSTDSLSHTTTYAYSPNFYGAFVTQTTMPSTSSPNPASHIVSGNYDFNTGLLTSFTDQNSQTTTYSYDVMLRPTNATYPSPDGGQTNFYYPNTTTVETQKSIDGTRTTDSFTYYDGLGRECRTMAANDESNPWDEVDTLYDAVGRASFKSYPYQGSGTPPSGGCSSTQPGDAFTYDPLNRVTQVAHSDGTTVLTSYTGRATSVQDEGNGTQRVQRISQVDGLGRLASVCEVASATQLGTGGTPGACGQDIAGTGFLTTYGYDALSNLTSISQGGYLPRSFAHDSLSRLTTATNPESGTITYGYDNASRLTTRTAPKPSQTSSVTVTTTMGYDEINRLRTKTYANSDSSTNYLAPSVTLNYDETSALGVSGLLNTIGRESSAVVAGSQAGEVFSYDKLGRVKVNSQCTPQNCSASTVFPVTYTYDLLGDTLTASNGVGVTLTYPAYNRALRITGMTSSLSDSNHPGTLYSAAHYNGAGSLLSATIGNPGSSVSETRGYDGRLRVTNITDGSLYTVTIPTNGYAPDGDILQANDSLNGNWTYGYDAVNRLISASATGQSYTYDYDRFGNRWHQNGPHSMQLSFSDNNNRMDTYSYDAAGNLLNDGTTTYTYDSESRVISATNSTSGTSTYLYDAEGRRIRKTTTAGGTVDFLYDLGGHEITQVSSAGAWTRGEIYAGGRHLGTYTGGTSGNTYFTFSDWLGTERARALAGAAGTCETITSLPFGDGESVSGSCGDPSPMHFTGKERDSESGLDNFGGRYDSSQYGRFMKPDWSAKPTSVPYAVFNNPQSLNLYAYVQNNPLTNKDPDGHWCLFGRGTTCQPPPPPPPQSAGQSYANAYRGFHGNSPNPQAAGTAALIGVGGAIADSIPSVKGGVSSTVNGVTVSSDGTTSATNTVVGVSVDLSVTRQGASESTTEVSAGVSKHTSAGVLLDANTGQVVGGAAHVGVGIGPPVTVSTTLGRTSDILSQISSGLKSIVNNNGAGTGSIDDAVRLSLPAVP